MRFFVIVLGLAAVGLGGGNPARAQVQPEPATPLLARYHFVGGAALSADTNAAKLTNIWAMASARDFAASTLDKLARAPLDLWLGPARTNAADHAAALRPLLDDLLREESCGEWRSVSNRTVETLFAIKLSDARATNWSTTLTTITKDWDVESIALVTMNGGLGWHLKTRKTNAPNLMQFARVGAWVVIGIGQDQLTMFDGAVGRAVRQQTPVESEGAGWLTMFVDLPRLDERAKWNLPLPPGELRLVAFGRDENVRVEGTLRFAQALRIPLPEWQLPTHQIAEPLISFTVARGFGPWLAEQSGWRDLGLGDIPNQGVGWALAGVPFHTFWAVPTVKATNTLAALESRLNVLVANFPERARGSFHYEPTNATLAWGGVPIMAPFARRVEDGGREFVLAGFFPKPGQTNSPAKALYEAFQAKTNLVYYDWEITQFRLETLRQLAQLLCVISGRPQAQEQDKGWRWLPDVAPLLGNTVTEITQKSPTELAFTRRGHLGLTALELTTIVRALDWEGFPAHPWGWLKPDPKAFRPLPVRRPLTQPGEQPSPLPPPK